MEQTKAIEPEREQFHRTLISIRLTLTSSKPFRPWGGLNKIIIELAGQTDNELREKIKINLEEAKEILERVKSETGKDDSIIGKSLRKRGISTESVDKTINWFDSNYK